MKRIHFFATLVLVAGRGLLLRPERQRASHNSGSLRIQWRVACGRGRFAAVVMVVTDESGSLDGAILFHFHMRKTVNDAVHFHTGTA